MNASLVSMLSQLFCIILIISAALCSDKFKHWKHVTMRMRNGELTQWMYHTQIIWIWPTNACKSMSPTRGIYHLVPLVTLFDFQVSWGHCKTLNSLHPLCFGSVSASTNWMERGDGPRWITTYLGAIGITENQASILVKIAPARNFQCSNGTAVFIISYFLTCARYGNNISTKPVVMLEGY